MMCTFFILKKSLPYLALPCHALPNQTLRCDAMRDRCGITTDQDCNSKNASLAKPNLALQYLAVRCLAMPNLGKIKFIDKLYFKKILALPSAALLGLAMPCDALHYLGKVTFFDKYLLYKKPSRD